MSIMIVVTRRIFDRTAKEPVSTELVSEEISEWKGSGKVRKGRVISLAIKLQLSYSCTNQALKSTVSSSIFALDMQEKRSSSSFNPTSLSYTAASAT